MSSNSFIKINKKSNKKEVKKINKRRFSYIYKKKLK